VNAPAWSRGLEVTGGGTGVVSHAGLVLVRQLADRTTALATRDFRYNSTSGGTVSPRALRSSASKRAIQTRTSSKNTMSAR
jgi:hypothetical protein